MAMEIFTLSDRQLGSIKEWQQAIDAEHFPVHLSLSTDIAFPHLQGFLPVHYDNTQTGFECDHWDSRSTIAAYPDVNFGHRWKFALGFRFGGRAGELESAWIAATAYARATRGVVFDTEECRVFEPKDAAQLILKIENNRPLRASIDEAIRRKLSVHK